MKLTLGKTKTGHEIHVKKDGTHRYKAFCGKLLADAIRSVEIDLITWLNKDPSIVTFEDSPVCELCLAGVKKSFVPPFLLH